MSRHLLGVLADRTAWVVMACSLFGNTAVEAQAIESVTIFPPSASELRCSEHPMGQEDHPGDALATDCVVVRIDAGPFGNFPRFHDGDGTRNEDWFSWNEEVFAPFDGVVRLILINEHTNRPGVRGEGPSTAVLFERFEEDAGPPIQVGYVHLRELRIGEGDTVSAGQVVGRIGNNGISDFPHLHVGAMRGDLARLLAGDPDETEVIPLQVRFDLAALGRLRGYVP